MVSLLFVTHLGTVLEIAGDYLFCSQGKSWINRKEHSVPFLFHSPQLLIGVLSRGYAPLQFPWGIEPGK